MVPLFELLLLRAAKVKRVAPAGKWNLINHYGFASKKRKVFSLGT